MSERAPNAIDKFLARPAYAAAIGAALLVLILLLWRWPTAILIGYLAGWTFWLGVPLGAAGIALIHRLSGGDWGSQLLDQTPLYVRPLPVMAVLFIPVLLGMKWLYPWATHGVIEPFEQSKFRHWYLREGFFVFRAILYFAAWLFIAKVGTGSRPRRRPVGSAGVCFVLLIVTITLAATDWLGTLAADFYSTIFGLYLAIAFGLTALCLLVIAAVTRNADVPLKRMNDWGNLLLTFVILHGYFAFSQFLIVWSGNLPREIGWYTERVYGAWGATALLLIVVQLFLPMFVLLFRGVKRQPKLLATVAGGVLAAQWIEMAWLVIPSLQEKSSRTWETLLALLVMVVVSAAIGLLAWPRLLTNSPAATVDGEQIA
ncbi:hypothetical protein BH10PLA1_BH10PLA1_15950 [soil metagenome]